ncbi:unnamed protein product, partial [Ectocarpus sp. 12 AP-2014]
SWNPPFRSRGRYSTKSPRKHSSRRSRNQDRLARHSFRPRRPAASLTAFIAGFTLTPVIWIFVAPRLSAGRVQGVALATVVERDRARLKFKSADCWDVVANATAAGGTWCCTLEV